MWTVPFHPPPYFICEVMIPKTKSASPNVCRQKSESVHDRNCSYQLLSVCDRMHESVDVLPLVVRTTLCLHYSLKLDRLLRRNVLIQYLTSTCFPPSLLRLRRHSSFMMCFMRVAARWRCSTNFSILWRPERIRLVSPQNEEITCTK